MQRQFNGSGTNGKFMFAGILENVLKGKINRTVILHIGTFFYDLLT